MLRCLSVVGLSIALTSCALAEEGRDSFRRHIVNADSTFCACAVMDVNGDGQLDIVSGGSWYEAPNWEPRPLREVEEIRGRF